MKMLRLSIALIVVALLTGYASNPLIEDSKTKLIAKITPDGLIEVEYESSKNQDMTWTDPVTGRTLTITARQDDNLINTAGNVQALTNQTNAQNLQMMLSLASQVVVPVPVPE